MDKDKLKYLCRALGKATGLGVRIYWKGELQYYYSLFHIEPDPVKPYIKEILEQKWQQGVITTPLFQFFGYLHIGTLAACEGDIPFEEGYCMIAGPSGMLVEDSKCMKEFMFLMDIKENRKKEYGRRLSCTPAFSGEQMAWLVSFLATAVSDRVVPVENIYISTDVEQYKSSVAKQNAEQEFRAADDEMHSRKVRDSYNHEKLIMSCIQNGQTEHLAEIFQAVPRVSAGEMAKDTLRQAKNIGICAAAIVSRTAIEGGMDSQRAFQLSDLYIQKFEVLKEQEAILCLINEMMLDYAGRVREVKYICAESSVLFERCSGYISQNLFQKIKVEELAEELGYARTYLCAQFKKVSGITLSDYIKKQKIEEAKRLMQFTDKNLAEIASHLAFSSQSYFQKVFKEVTGKTPVQYRDAAQS